MTDSLIAHLIDRLGWVGDVTARSNGAKLRGKLTPFPRPKTAAASGRHTDTRGDAIPIEDVLAWMSESEGDDD